MARREAWRGVTRAVTSVDVVAWMLHTSCGGVVRVLVNGALQLLQKLIDVQEITLSPEVGKRQRVGVHRRVLRLSDHRATVSAILRHAGALVTAAENWELDSLEAHKSLANVIVSGRVDCTTLGVSKEFIQRIIGSALPDLVVIGELLSLVDSVINGTIGRILRWASIKASGSAARVLLAIASVGTKRAIRILISTRCSGKRLQVSDHCRTPVRY